ncbi:hypothetical protein [Acidisoma cellulosilyticum]|nr:hypothetical protein [Acidisoma cellulosilyticum]
MAEPMKSQPARGSAFRPAGMIVALVVSLLLLVLFHFMVDPHF